VTGHPQTKGAMATHKNDLRPEIELGKRRQEKKMALGRIVHKEQTGGGKITHVEKNGDRHTDWGFTNQPDGKMDQP